MTPKQQIKIVIAEDHKMLLDGLAGIVRGESNIEVVGLAQNGKQALDMIEDKQPDLVIVDIRMPVMDGIELTKILREKFPMIKILILSLYGQNNLIEKLIELEIDGYLLKEKGQRELVTAINNIMAGEKYMDSAVIKWLMKPTKTKDALTPREKEVLILTAKSLSAAQIATKLKITEITVNTYKRRIKEKLKLKGAANYLKYALKNGYISLEELDDGAGGA
ncbi:MAG: response regulator transcription factor [Bacteroidota bacterium]